MNIGYLIYEAERPKSAAEQRATDIRAGELAASIARFGRSLKGAVMRVAGMTRADGSAAEAGAGATSVCVADLERLYAAPSAARPALDSRGADGECTVRSC